MSVQALNSHGIGRTGEDKRYAPSSHAQGAPVQNAAFISASAPRPSSSSIEESSSDMGVVSRVLAGIDSVGAVPSEVSVYSQPMGHSIVTDVVVHRTDQNDGTESIGNHWQGVSIPAPEPRSSPGPSVGIGASGLRVGAYEESRTAAHEAYMMFQGLKLNQTV